MIVFNVNICMIKQHNVLAYLGTLPFIGCAVLIGVGVDQVPVLGEVEAILIGYGVIISTFMVGAHWGQHLNIPGPLGNKLAIASNAIALSVWIAALKLAFIPMIAVLIVIFAVLLGIDRYMLSVKVIEISYFKTRFVVSAIVISCLLMSVILKRIAVF